MTDVYFHYTPSQIMLAALSLADRELAERVIHETFHHHHHDPAAEQTKETNRKGSAAAAAGEQRASRLIGVEMRDRVAGVVASCREILAREPPERLTAYWGAPESQQITRPLLRKLKKCRDPDRWDLVAYQNAKREQARQKDEDAAAARGGEHAQRGRRASLDGGGDGAVFGDVHERDVKRRKVAKTEDPFGGPL